jgi:hypothetical protein
VVLTVTLVSVERVQARPSDNLWPFANCGAGREPSAVHFGTGLPAFGHPLLAEPRAAMVRLMVGGADTFGFIPTLSKEPQMIGEFELGHEFGIVGGCFARGQVGTESSGLSSATFGLWTPVDFHMVQSLSAESMPILNTDFRYSIVFRATAPVREHWIGVKAAVGHESTHIGDEITISRIEQTSPFFRVNVSYEYWELTGSWDRLATTQSPRRFAGRLGLIRTWKGRFYNAEKEAAECRPDEVCLLRPTELKTEPYVSGEAEFYKKTFSIVL